MAHWLGTVSDDGTVAANWADEALPSPGDDMSFGSDAINAIAIPPPEAAYGSLEITAGGGAIFTNGTTFTYASVIGESLNGGTFALLDILGPGTACCDPYYAAVVNQYAGGLLVAQLGSVGVVNLYGGTCYAIADTVNVYGGSSPVVTGPFLCQRLNVYAALSQFDESTGVVNLSGTAIRAYASFTIEDTGAFGITATGAIIYRNRRDLTITQTGVSITERWGPPVRRLVPRLVA